MTADLIILNARVLTMDDSSPRAEAVAVQGNRILAVGETSAIRMMTVRRPASLTRRAAP